MKPKVAVTLGDPFGIGPEITAKTLKNPLVKSKCIPILMGDVSSLSKYGIKISDFAHIDTGVTGFTKPKSSTPSAFGGAVSFKALEIACKLAACGKVDGVVTAPISKKAWQLAGIPFNGHTDFFRNKFQAKDILMTFVSKNIRCALLTEHIALKAVAENLTKSKIEKTCKSFTNALRLIGIKQPKIVFCGLNPHLGDRGAFAKEDIKIISPALKKFKNITLMPSDAAWQKHIAGLYDGIICTYHDQALIGLKIASASPVVHWTYGLPFIRTSPTHGTAFDIAGKNIADARSMKEAILFCADMCGKYKKS